MDTGRELRILAEHSSRVMGVAVSGDGQRVVSASHDKMLRLWDVETAKVLAAFTMDGPNHSM